MACKIKKWRKINKNNNSHIKTALQNLKIKQYNMISSQLFLEPEWAIDSGPLHMSPVDRAEFCLGFI